METETFMSCIKRALKRRREQPKPIKKISALGKYEEIYEQNCIREIVNDLKPKKVQKKNEDTNQLVIIKKEERTSQTPQINNTNIKISKNRTSCYSGKTAKNIKWEGIEKVNREFAKLEKESEKRVKKEKKLQKKKEKKEKRKQSLKNALNVILSPFKFLHK